VVLRSLDGIADSNPDEGMEMSALVCCACCKLRSLRQADSSSSEVLPCMSPSVVMCNNNPLYLPCMSPSVVMCNNNPLYLP
jgi:hypothetical protein